MAGLKLNSLLLTLFFTFLRRWVGTQREFLLFCAHAQMFRQLPTIAFIFYGIATLSYQAPAKASSPKRY